MERFFGYDIDYDLAIKVFSWQHFVFIALAILTVVLTLRYADKLYEFKRKSVINKTVFIILILLESTYHIHNWFRNQFSVPLHLCSFSIILSIMLVKTRKQKYFDLLFFIGPLGGIVALIFPEMGGFTYYSFRYYHFIIAHLFIISVPLYYYKAHGMRVNLYSLKKTYLFLLIMAPIVFTVNRVFDMNYIFINRKPNLDIVANNIPEWPYYIVVFIVGVLLFHTVLYKVSNHSKFNNEIGRV